MGIADREYIREPMTRRRDSAVPGMSLISANTWIIIINVAVYLLGATLLSRPVATSCGTAWGKGVSKDDRANAVVIREETLREPATPWILYHPIVPGPSASRPPVVSLQTGVPVVQEIGRERFSYHTPLEAIGQFSTGKAFAEMQVWRFITFQFLHANLTHLAFNMLGLWFVGGIVEEYLGRRRYAAFYLTCGVLGGICYMLLNLLGFAAGSLFPAAVKGIPFLLALDPYTPLVGASAGVFGVLLAAAYIAPNSIVQVMLVLPMRMRTAVYIFLALAVVNLFRGGTNAGGDAAHVGGALAGYFLVRRTHALRGILGTFGIGDDRDNRDASGWSQRDGSGKAIFKPSPALRTQIEVDRILEKTRTRGLGSLTDAERRTLREANDRPDET